ncbi:hypothetical protein RHGRI_004902 [Rhododendron griersonianum]|uniref:Uncharacterized protein n=1 Tax=Rhododendron griersonianum TaxID=479676 RepID=A0AAV6JFY6_9ERIC|nr:hypothetical protein RHGRI_019326 [Rhododendron griersonianum]KAG5562015.1 hypothetical protein RHGRI_004902 [Rhododendron griersonianum]
MENGGSAPSDLITSVGASTEVLMNHAEKRCQHEMLFYLNILSGLYNCLVRQQWFLREYVLLMWKMSRMGKWLLL